MKNARLTYLFQRFSNHSCTEGERQEFFELVAESENDEALKQLMDRLWSELPMQDIATSSQMEKIYAAVHKRNNRKTIINRSFSLSVWQKMAAALVLVILGSGTLFYFSQQKNQIPSQNSQNASMAARGFIALPDGSTVILNKGSKLEYPESFEGKSTREVYLIGEGFFDIQHDASRPFIVRTGKLMTTVLGTAFNVKAFPEENNITVTVTRGKVKVSDEENVLGIITRDQQITFSKKSLQAARENVNSEKIIEWIEKDIFFDDVTMEEAIAQLENRFRMKISLGSEKIKDCRFTATFIKGEDIDQILSIICEFNKATFSYDSEGMIIIKGDGC